jgi:mono/diheme cytochrome c family protein
MSERGTVRGKTAALLLAAILSAAACRQDLYNQPKYKPQAASEFFADGRAARPAVEGAIARGQLNDDAHRFTGRVDGRLVATFPYPVTRAMLDRGRERYTIFCAPCHDLTGNGNGTIVRRGLKQPPSFHIERLRSAPPGHFFDVISNGLGAMQDYSAQIPADDRWAIIAYMRALQLSQRATPADVPPEELRRLQEKRTP